MRNSSIRNVFIIQGFVVGFLGSSVGTTLSAFSSGGEQKIESSSKIIADIRQLIKTEHISAYSLNQALVSSRDAPRGILLKGISQQRKK